MIPADAESTEFRKSLVVLYPSLLKYAQRLSHNPADAEDLVHDAIERGLRRRALFHTGTPSSWMITILRHIFLDGCRRARRWKEVAPAWARLHLEATIPWPGEMGRLEGPCLSDAYATADVRRAVPMLRPPLREVFRLFVFHRLSQREIGRRLGLPLSTVGTRLLRARRRLRKILDEGPRQRRPLARAGDEVGLSAAA